MPSLRYNNPVVLADLWVKEKGEGSQGPQPLGVPVPFRRSPGLCSGGGTEEAAVGNGAAPAPTHSLSQPRQQEHGKRESDRFPPVAQITPSM